VPREPLREALAVWLAMMGGLVALTLLGGAVPAVAQLLGAVAVAAFLVAPTFALERRGQDARDAGFRSDRLWADLGWSLGACALILPPFALAFARFVKLLPQLPARVQPLLAPYLGAPHPLHLTLPQDAAGMVELLGRIGGNAAVALAEEFFYRGYLTLRLEERFPPRTRILGAPLGLGAVLAAGLFALGHLLVPAPFRLAVFFPALLFAWLRARTGTVVGAAICHFLFNVALLLLERAAY
jgi:membrane protease YdiL (CAAX protease family)